MYDDTFLHSMAQFLYLLSGDPAFSTALPFCSHNIVRQGNRRDEDRRVYGRSYKARVEEVHNRV